MNPESPTQTVVHQHRHSFEMDDNTSIVLSIAVVLAVVLAIVAVLSWHYTARTNKALENGYIETTMVGVSGTLWVKPSK